ncbi:MAG: hypothetical protein Q8P27_01665 [Candidatus Peregrinibacteria bacterium]|nr:hypothetical protein [Candidatus Peregrinibacteria bacterium]
MITYENLFQEAITRRYVAAMFDVDGTLTQMGSGDIPKPLLEHIGQLSMQVPLAICTGRRFKGILDKLQLFIDEAPDEMVARKNWYLFIENGAIGIRYNSETQEYERFYQIDWPEEHITMQSTLETILPLVEAVHPVETRLNECNIGIYPLNQNGYTKKELAEITSDMSTVIRDSLNTIPEGERLQVVDSGIATHVIDIRADKDRGIREFGNILRNRGIKLTEQDREILIIGDQPGEGCNDAKFLEGKWGTPFTAEHLFEGREYPIPIFENGEILKGPTATMSLLKQIQFDEIG